MRNAFLAAGLAVVTSLGGCVSYEYEHEFWLRVDGSGRVHVSGRPELWTAFKGVHPEDPELMADRVRRLFESSGLRVSRVRLTRRRGRPHLFVAAEFDDANRLGRSRAFPDLSLSLAREGERMRLEGVWSPPGPRREPTAAVEGGLMAVRFHLPSKVYEHKNAFAGVERGNIVGWRQDVTAALEGHPLAFGATLDVRSILWSTVTLFVGAILAAGLLLGGAIALAVRRGRRARRAGG